VSDPVAFGLARLAEEEAGAGAAFEAAPGRWHAGAEDILIRTPDPHWNGFCVANAAPPFDAHIAQFDPARELRDIGNKRAILAEHIPYDCTRPAGQRCDVCVSHEVYPNGVAVHQPWPCTTVRRLIARWDDHPDYLKEEWKP